jgi:hypothetical protein
MDAIYENIEKESIPFLKFPDSDVLVEGKEKYLRNSDLIRAQSLGNLEHSKIKIFFEDNESKKVVETTVWALTNTTVILKKGVEIPIKRIYKIV